MRHHVTNHLHTGRPSRSPTIAPKLLQLTALHQLQQPHTSKSTLRQPGPRVLLRTTRPMQLHRHPHLRSIQPHPLHPHIVHMRNDRRNRPHPTHRLRSPGSRIQPCQQQLNHALIHREDLRSCPSLYRTPILHRPLPLRTCPGPTNDSSSRPQPRGFMRGGVERPLYCFAFVVAGSPLLSSRVQCLVSFFATAPLLKQQLNPPPAPSPPQSSSHAQTPAAPTPLLHRSTSTAPHNKTAPSPSRQQPPPPCLR
jgi:hypothetical protein